MDNTNADLLDLNSKFIGHWQGTYCLVLSWLPEPNFISASNLTVTPVSRGKFLTFTYDWEYEGAAQEGLLLIGNMQKQDGVTASWVDSWGMSGAIMECHGTITSQGDIVLRGGYAVKDSPDWGWRIEIPCPGENSLQILMYNVSPEGEEFLAGDANYIRI